MTRPHVVFAKMSKCYFFTVPINEYMCCTSALRILLIKHGGVQPFAGEVNASLSSAASLVACLHPLLTIGTGCQKQPRKDCRRGPWDVFLSVNAHTHTPSSCPSEDSLQRMDPPT